MEAGWGTQFYMSPEAQRGDAVVTEKADVFRCSPRLRLFLLSCVCSDPKTRVPPPKQQRSFGVCLWQLLSRESTSAVCAAAY